MNKQAKENYQNLWNEFIEVLPPLVKNGAAGSVKGYIRKLNGFFTDIFETTDKDPIQTEEFRNLEKAYEEIEEDMDNPQIDNPTHYQSYNPQINIDCITAMRAAFGDEEVAIFCKLNAFKYNWRADSKGKNVDIGKAVWYLNKYLELNK